ncbi:low temperature requirement protein A [Pseudonocardia eucalypti]|uniref:Low temperature requirement protein A n=1 Tax=Pseudonocardia eucalypti TaxID=648755 RepID=A0ABP9PEJ0_9PSEU|nr:low temperature requirement protein LtrA [Pseudonocardia eucalypti]
MTGNWVRPMLARERTEEHRTATALELFFDLCFVVAVALAASGLHHALTEAHVGAGVLGYLMVVFAIWWAWNNFTAFASAYDNDDGLYRLTTLVQIVGALVLAAGVPAALEKRDLLVVTAGYVIMRLAMVAQWLRAARSDPPRRATALRFAAGITAVQVGWVLRLALPGAWGVAGFVVLALAEMAVPVWAERVEPTTWHPEHLAERYSLFTLIVLGEVVLASTSAIQHSLADGEHLGTLLGLAAAGVVIVFAMWWLYFDRPAPRALDSLSAALPWAYGHYPVFAAVAAVGAGLEVAVDFDTGQTTLTPMAAGWATAVPVAVYVLVVWLLRIRGGVMPAWLNASYPVVALLVLASPFSHAPIHVTAVLLAALVTARSLGQRRG